VRDFQLPSHQVEGTIVSHNSLYWETAIDLRLSDEWYFALWDPNLKVYTLQEINLQTI